MNAQLDWIGAAQVVDGAFYGPKRRRQAVFDEKQALRQRLRELTSRAPEWLGSAGVMATQEWINRRKKAVKAMDSERASVRDLKSAVTSMERGAA